MSKKEKLYTTGTKKSDPGWQSTFIFDGSIEEIKKGVYETEINSPDLNQNALKVFNDNFAKFRENFTFQLLIQK